ncbi:MAG: T9SS type A sorting domain-containing protein [Chlorobi bacterium]|nr:T9SS type A sorting domain-containing protein [Chlorobiota bacterium]
MKMQLHSWRPDAQVVHPVIIGLLLSIVMLSQASSQIISHPAKVEFGEIGVDRVIGSSTIANIRSLSVINTSTDQPLTIHQVKARSYSKGVIAYIPTNGLDIRINPTDSFSFGLYYATTEADENFGKIAIIYSYPKQINKDTLYIPFHGRAIIKSEPFINHVQYPTRLHCDCPATRDSAAWSLYPIISNPTDDTLQVDSISYSHSSSGIFAKEDYTIYSPNSNPLQPPIREHRQLPTFIPPHTSLMGEIAIMNRADSYNNTMVKVHLRKRKIEPIILESNYSISLLSRPEPVIVNNIGHLYDPITTRYNDSTGFDLTLSPCNASNALSVTIDSITFKGIHKNNLKIDYLLQNPPIYFPISLSPCSDLLNSISMTGKFIGGLPSGLTIDTVDIQYHYTDTLNAVIYDSVQALSYLRILTPLNVPRLKQISKISIHPIPANKHIVISSLSMNNKIGWTAKIYDITGKERQRASLTEGGEQFQINIENLPVGNYVVVVTDDEEFAWQAFFTITR